MDWAWIDEDLSVLCRDKGRPAVPTRFMIGLLLLKQINGLSDEGVCEHEDRWPSGPQLSQGIKPRCGLIGDHANAVLTAVGYNLRLILTWLRLLLRKILQALLPAFSLRPIGNPAS